MEFAEREKLSVREIGRWYGARTEGNMIGSAADIADTMELWLDSGAADGFMIQATHVPAAFEEFAEQVVPELRRRGLVRTAYTGGTLRDNLGLARPERGEWRNRAKLSRAESAGDEPNRANLSRANLSRGEPNRDEPNRAESSRAESAGRGAHDLARRPRRHRLAAPAPRRRGPARRHRGPAYRAGRHDGLRQRPRPAHRTAHPRRAVRRPDRRFLRRLGPVPFTRPTTSAIEAYARSLGVREDSTVVVYDRLTGAWAARVWWVLRTAGITRVHVLNGGLTAWEAAGLPVTRAGPPRGAGRRHRPARARGLHRHRAHEADRRRQRPHPAVCAAAHRVSGCSGPAPLGPHPRTANLPYADLLGTDNRLSAERTARLAEAHGLRGDTQTVLYCGGRSTRPDSPSLCTRSASRTSSCTTVRSASGVPTPTFRSPPARRPGKAARAREGA
ncbi:rhodanese-like domain-containing protein [Streptomyces sp. M19]